jgi:opacity protein-like surface antigen
MITKTIWAILLSLVFSIFSYSNANAQKAGLGLIYGDQQETVGISLDGSYRFHRFFRITGNAALFLPKEQPLSSDEANWWSVNINGNFVFLDKGRFQTYALTGLNYATIKYNTPATGEVTVDSKVGLNVGGGIEYAMSFGHIFGESKYVFIDDRYQQTTINAGVRFYLSERK